MWTLLVGQCTAADVAHDITGLTDSSLLIQWEKDEGCFVIFSDDMILPVRILKGFGDAVPAGVIGHQQILAG